MGYPISESDWVRAVLKAGDRVSVEGDRSTFVLSRSRWEGARFRAWESRLRPDEDGALLFLLRRYEYVRVFDDRYSEDVPAPEFVADRAAPAVRAERYVVPPRYLPGEWNTMYVPGADVAAGVGGRSVTVTLRRSRWEGLHFVHPASLVGRTARGDMSVRFGPGWSFKLLGGGQVVRPSPADLFRDRCSPLEEPGESLAVTDAVEWHRITFCKAHVSRPKKARGVVMARFPAGHARFPGAVVFHPAKLARWSAEDGSCTWRFHADWEFKVHDSQGTVNALPASEFLVDTGSWAGLRPPAFRGVRRVHPDLLDPVVDVAVPDDLRDSSEAPRGGHE